MWFGQISALLLEAQASYFLFLISALIGSIMGMALYFLGLVGFVAP
jgi:hypothetical protein